MYYKYISSLPTFITNYLMISYISLITFFELHHVIQSSVYACIAHVNPINNDNIRELQFTRKFERIPNSFSHCLV